MHINGMFVEEERKIGKLGEGNRRGALTPSCLIIVKVVGGKFGRKQNYPPFKNTPLPLQIGVESRGKTKNNLQ